MAARSRTDGRTANSEQVRQRIFREGLFEGRNIQLLTILLSVCNTFGSIKDFAQFSTTSLQFSLIQASGNRVPGGLPLEFGIKDRLLVNDR
jgi:hypothetical protein